MITNEHLRRFKDFINPLFEASKDRDSFIKYLIHNLHLDNYETDEIHEIINELSDQYNDIIYYYEDAVCPTIPTNYNEMFPTLTEEEAYNVFNKVNEIFNSDKPIDYKQVLNSYPDDIKDPAIKIYESGKAPEYLQHYIESNHIGDKNELSILLIDLFTPFLINGTPNHIDTVGSSESGKTRLTNVVSSIIPDKYLTVVKTVSPKYLFYKEDWNSLYNYILVQDAVDSDIINLLKTITDPENVGELTHSTVIDKKAVDLTIEGKVLTIITHAKDFNDVELNTRLRRINPDESEDHNNKVKEELRYGFGQLNTDNDKYKLVAQALFELLSSEPIKVFNPYMNALDVTKFSKRDIKMFRNSVNALTFLNKKSRKITSSGILIGTYEDFKKSLMLWNKYQPLQQYKLTSKQIELLKLLNTIPDDNLIINSDNEDTKGYTYKELAEILGTSRNTLQYWANGRRDKETQSEKIGLADQGLIEFKWTGEEKHSKVLLYRTKKAEELVSGDVITAITTYHNETLIDDSPSFDGMPSKYSLIYSFIIAITGKRSERSTIDNILQQHGIRNQTLANDKQIFEFINEMEVKGIIDEIINHKELNILDLLIDTPDSCDCII